MYAEKARELQEISIERVSESKSMARTLKRVFKKIEAASNAGYDDCCFKVRFKSYAYAKILMRTLEGYGYIVDKFGKELNIDWSGEL